MAYSRTTWANGDLITAEKLNNLESGIIGNETEIAETNADLADLNNAISQLSGLSEDVKTALLQIASKVAYIDDDGQDYYDDLYDALYPPTPPATLVSISAVYTQSGTVYDTDSLDSLKSDLVVTALYDDQTTATVTTYTLSGTLTVGTSTITVAYDGKTTTFNVTVTQGGLYPMTNGNHAFTANGYEGRTITVTNNNHVKYYNPNPNNVVGSGVLGSYAIFDNVYDNQTNAGTTNINNPSTPLFTLPASSTVVMEISNIEYDGLSGADTVTKYAIALRSGSTSIVTTGDLLPANTDKTVTKAISNDTNITCAFLYAGTAIETLEFDISVTVNGVKWI